MTTMLARPTLTHKAWSGHPAHIGGRRGGLATPAASIDDSLGLEQERRGNCQAQERGGPAIDHHLDARRLLDRQLAGVGALEDLVDEDGCLPDRRRASRW